MFWGLASGNVESELEFEHILKDIQTLNEWALEGRLETTAVSVHAYPKIADRYAIMRHGGSFGDDYGPMIVSREPLSYESLRNTCIAVPGKLTSAFLALNLYLPDPKFEVVAFDEILPEVVSGRFDAGLIIHEGQLTYGREGLHLVEDLGKWWKRETSLPLPLGVNVVRKDLGPEIIAEIDRCMEASIRAGLENRQKALDYALQFARGMDVKTSDKFVGMYVNERTLDMGEEGMAAIRLFLKKGHEIGLVSEIEPEFIY